MFICPRNRGDSQPHLLPELDKLPGATAVTQHPCKLYSTARSCSVPAPENQADLLDLRGRLP